MIDAAAYSVMVGCGETYLPAFALALGLGPIVAGMVASVPLLVGATVQLAARSWCIALVATDGG